VKPISKRVFKLFVVDVSDCDDQSSALSFQCHSAKSCKKEFNCYNNMAFTTDYMLHSSSMNLLTRLPSSICDKSLDVNISKDQKGGKMYEKHS
jgi:hypothetical protein